MFQQWVFQGVLHRRLRKRLPAPWCIVLTSSAFAAVHVGYTGLVALTAIAGLFWSWAWSRWPDTVVVGVSHGILASFAHPWLLGDDPLARIGG